MQPTHRHFLFGPISVSQCGCDCKNSKPTDYISCPNSTAFWGLSLGQATTQAWPSRSKSLSLYPSRRVHLPLVIHSPALSLPLQSAWPGYCSRTGQPKWHDVRMKTHAALKAQLDRPPTHPGSRTMPNRAIDQALPEVVYGRLARSMALSLSQPAPFRFPVTCMRHRQRALPCWIAHPLRYLKCHQMSLHAHSAERERERGERCTVDSSGQLAFRANVCIKRESDGRADKFRFHEGMA